MSEIREAVRSRYADAAKKIAVLQPGPGVGCCQVDGPDCGCAGSYAAEDLQQIGMSDAVSLGCGNPTMLADLKPGEVVLDLGSGAGRAAWGDAGFAEPAFEVHATQDLPGVGRVGSAYIRARKPYRLTGAD